MASILEFLNFFDMKKLFIVIYIYSAFFLLPIYSHSVNDIEKIYVVKLANAMRNRPKSDENHIDLYYLAENDPSWFTIFMEHEDIFEFLSSFIYFDNGQVTWSGGEKILILQKESFELNDGKSHHPHEHNDRYIGYVGGNGKINVEKVPVSKIESLIQISVEKNIGGYFLTKNAEYYISTLREEDVLLSDQMSVLEGEVKKDEEVVSGQEKENDSNVKSSDSDLNMSSDDEFFVFEYKPFLYLVVLFVGLLVFGAIFFINKQKPN